MIWSSDRLFKLAVFCGAAPLVLGISIYGLWLWTNWHALINAGIVMLIVGPVMCLVGFVSLSAYLWKTREKEAPIAAFWMRGRLIFMLLLLNFPVAAFCAIAAIGKLDRHGITISNESGQPIVSVKLVAPGSRAELGTIEAGKSLHAFLRVRGDGTMSVECSKGERIATCTVDDYVTAGMIGSNYTVRVLDSGDFVVLKNEW